MGYAGQALSIGRKDGMIRMSRRDDTARRLRLTGRAAAFAKEWVSRSAKFGARTAVRIWLPEAKR